MLFSEVKIGDTFTITADRPFTGTLQIVKHNGGKRLAFDFPKSVKINKQSQTRTGRNEDQKF